jgi:hypothetical protein
MERVRAIQRHEPSERPPIQIVPGEDVTVGERDTDWPAFVFVTTADGAGWVPARYLSAAEPGAATVVTAYDTTELATEVGEVVDVVVRDDEGGWLWCRSASGREGWVPVRALEPYVL